MTDDIEPSPSPARLRIALSDDHPVVRAGVRALLESAAAPDEAWSVDGEAS
ncbi:DNA-binding response regulator, partial [Salinisphaera sp. USBA-960]|nr:DNA-binding response regulator [Salifodinibacter halophilus]